MLYTRNWFYTYNKYKYNLYKLIIHIGYILKNLTTNEKQPKRKKFYNNNKPKSGELVLNLFLRSSLLSLIQINFLLLPFLFLSLNVMPFTMTLVIAMCFLLALCVFYKNNYTASCYIITISTYISVIFMMFLYYIIHMNLREIVSQIPFIKFLLELYSIKYIVICSVTLLLSLRLCIYLHQKIKIKDGLVSSFFKDFISILVFSCIVIFTMLIVFNNFSVLTETLTYVLLYTSLSSLICSMVLLAINKTLRKRSYTNKSRNLSNRKFRNEKYNATNAKSSEPTKKDGGNSARN